MKAIYIDVQNVHKGIQKLGRIIDRSIFYAYLKEKYTIDTCVMFIGYVPKFESWYRSLKNIGYEIVFKETIVLPTNEIKGNVDIDLAIRAIDDWHIKGISHRYLASGDGDYNSLVSYFKDKNIPYKVLIPGTQDTSKLLTKAAGNNILNIANLRQIIEKKPTRSLS